MSVVLLPCEAGTPVPYDDNANRTRCNDNEAVLERGNGHSSRLFRGLYDLWKDNQLTDVTLKVENRSFRCHRNVLASTSPYFHRMFCSNMQESRSKVVALKGIKAESLSTILDFTYTSRMTINNDNLPNVLEAADMLLMPEVKQFCIEYMEQRLGASNCLGIYALADRFNCADLATRAWQYALRNFRTVRKHAEILEQPLDILEMYLSTDDLVIEGEEEVFATMIAWINRDKKGRLSSLTRLVSHLREHLLPTQYLVEKVLSNPLVAKSQSLFMTIENSARNRGDMNLQPQQTRSRHVVLVVGGIGPANIKLTEVKYFDPIDRRWSTFSHLPFDAETVSCVGAVDDDVYVMGSRGSFIMHCSRDADWMELPPLPTERLRQRLACSSGDGNLYYVGGFDGTQRVRMVDRFSTQDKTWHTLEPLPNAVSSPATIVYGNKLYVFGGALANGTPTDIVHSYDLDGSGLWEPRARMPHAFSGITAVALGTHIYIVGSVSTVVHRYDPALDAWSQAEDLTNTHALCGATVCAGKIYVTGGENKPNSPISGVEGYDPTTNRWSPCNRLPYPIRLHGCASVIKRI
ncbi:kelch-like protein 24 [Diadema setosum]|uniref:kelch-like protein 24 n=1 Tax=Diadema setosum TaxID=31175 RepID=UPI003B3BE828